MVSGAAMRTGEEREQAGDREGDDLAAIVLRKARQSARVRVPWARTGARSDTRSVSSSDPPPPCRGPVSTSLPPDEAAGRELFDLAARLLPIRRSLTGGGVRETLHIVGGDSPLELTEVPSGSAAFDWIVPPEWNVRAASITDSDGVRLVDL